MIFCAVHSAKSGFAQLDREFYEDFCDGVLSEGDYEKLAATLLGMADFLAGPDRFFRLDAEDNHNAIRALLAAVRKEIGMMSTGAGYRALVAALGERLPEIADGIAAASAAQPLDPLQIRAMPGRNALSDWQALTEAVMEAFERRLQEADAQWASDGFDHVTIADWESVFARAPQTA